MDLAGHYWTLKPRLVQRWHPRPLPPGQEWSTNLEDPKVGPVRLTGRYLPAPQESDGDGLVVLVHGLGGCIESAYIPPFAHEVQKAGLACLAFNLRGSDRSGEDFYHAGLIEDLDAALASPEVRRHRRVYIVGFSMGGHLTLRWAVERGSATPRVHAVAAVCSPLELAPAAAAFSQDTFVLYRRFIMKALLEIYEAVARRRSVPISVEEARRLQSVREFDEYIVAPRHGFEGANDYYARMSVGPRLSRLSTPALWLGSEADPMVHPQSVHPSADAASDAFTVRWTPRGGHVGFPEDLDVGLGPEKGLEGQVLGWLLGW